jgi:hypothetical protein
MPTIRNRLYPLKDVNDHDVINFFALDTSSGLAGQIVKIVTGAANPQNADGFSNTPVGTNVAGTFSNRYETKLKVTPTVSGDTRYNSLGFTLFSTLELDENGQPLKYNERRAKEIGAVISGETVPIATKASTVGFWGNNIDQRFGAPAPGKLAVISYSGNGIIGVVDPLSANFAATATAVAYTQAHVVGKWITTLPVASNTGLANEFSALGGYALLQFNMNA